MISCKKFVAMDAIERERTKQNNQTEKKKSCLSEINFDKKIPDAIIKLCLSKYSIVYTIYQWTTLCALKFLRRKSFLTRHPLISRHTCTLEPQTIQTCMHLYEGDDHRHPSKRNGWMRRAHFRIWNHCGGQPPNPTWSPDIAHCLLHPAVSVLPVHLPF